MELNCLHVKEVFEHRPAIIVCMFDEEINNAKTIFSTDVSEETKSI